MSKFDINGAVIEFDEKMDNYNEIRRLFKLYAQESSNRFEENCLNNIKNIKGLSEKGFDCGVEIIEEVLKKGVETIVSFDIITIDLNTFKEVYCRKYLDYERLFNNLNKESLIANKNKKNTYKFYGVKPLIKKLSEYIYNDCFNIHFAIVDALVENDVDKVGSHIDEDSIKKASALFNNYKDGFITKPDECRVVEQVIILNPYREDIYEFFIKEDGDFNREIERLANFLGYNVSGYKDMLMNLYIQELINAGISDLEFEKEKVKKYGKYIGCGEDAIYIARLDAICTFEHA
ncbi:MAG: kinase [Romboutsia sp.]